MNHLLTNLGSFVTETINYSRFVGDIESQRNLPDHLVRLKQEADRFRSRFETHVSCCSSRYAANTCIGKNHLDLVSLAEMLLYYLYQMEARPDQPAEMELKLFYNQICYEIEELLAFVEGFDCRDIVVMVASYTQVPKTFNHKS